MKISKIKSALTKANNAEAYYNRITNDLLFVGIVNDNSMMDNLL